MDGTTTRTTGKGGSEVMKLKQEQQLTQPAAAAAAPLLLVPTTATGDGQQTLENVGGTSSGAHSCSSSSNDENGQNSSNSLHKSDLELLGQLLKDKKQKQRPERLLQELLQDKKQLAAFPNVFSHVERLIDEEISRIRVAIFQCEFSREPLQLPEPIGEVIVQQEKVFVPVKQHPEYNFVGRILGPRGMTAKQLETETGCKIMVRGRGSMRDKKKEDMNRGKPNWEHLNEELHVIIQCEDTPNRNEVKMARAVEEVNKLLVPQPEGEDELKRKQLMELAIINGTFRNGAGTPNGTQQGGGTKLNGATPLLQLDQRLLLSGSLPSSASAAGFAGAPLIFSTGAHSAASQLLKNATGQNNSPMPLASAQPLMAVATSLAQQNQQQQQHAAFLQQLGMSNGFLATATPGPYGLALANTQSCPTNAGILTGTNGQFDLLALTNHIQQTQQQQQQFDQCQLSALLQQQQQQLALLQQTNGINFGDYANIGQIGTAQTAVDSTGAILSGQRRFVGHSRESAHPYGVQPSTGK